MEKKFKNIKIECCVCSSSVNSIDYSASEILSLNDIYNIYKCRKCKQRILHPQLSNNELDKLYSGSYFDNSENINFPNTQLIKQHQIIMLMFLLESINLN